MPVRNRGKSRAVGAATTHSDRRQQQSPPPQQQDPVEEFAALPHLPSTYQSLVNFIEERGEIDALALRREAFRRIERLTGRPLICYVTKTHHVAAGVPTSIDDSDLVGFDDLVQLVAGDAVDIFLVSNGGSAETTERIVRLLRGRFASIRYIFPANAYSAATLMGFSGDEIIMAWQGTLGPIDPQIGGIPARAILRAFETLEQRLKDEGPKALTAYVPLIEKYDLHILEICKTAEELSRELAQAWLSQYHLKIDSDDARVKEIVTFFSSYDLHKSHARSISRDQARKQGLNVVNAEDTPGLDELIRGLYHQYEFWFDKTPFVKMFEDARGTNWGRQAAMIQLPVSGPQPVPQPGPPQRTG